MNVTCANIAIIGTETVPTVAGSHMSLFRPSAPRIPKDESSPIGEVSRCKVEKIGGLDRPWLNTDLPLQKCEHCGKANGSPIVVCESCDNGYHGTCLDPPLKQRPDSEWNCPRCLVGDGQFGFEEGGLYSLKQFQEKAATFKANYFESRMPYDNVLKCSRPVTEDDVENEFWRLVSSLEETVEVEYGADIHCTTHGSGFPTPEKNPLNPYSNDPWNLNILPLHPESLYRYIRSDVSGMTVPWVYVGMTFSTFCWHNEDHYSYSANYQHFGATKTWYGIPAADAIKFERAMKEAVPELFETQPDLLFQLVTLLPPDQLRKAGVRVFALDQHAGEFVITFPQAYHAGFNHGFNFNEAVNFAPADWEPFGLAGVERLQEFRKQPCFSHDEMLWTAGEGNPSLGPLSIKTAKWLAPALSRMQEREHQQRELFRKRHWEVAPACSGQCTNQCPMEPKIQNDDVSEEEYQCSYCKAFTYLSRFKCQKSGKVFCLLHAGTQPCCDLTEPQKLAGVWHSLLYRRSDEAIDTLCRKIVEKAHLPEAWEEKYSRLLDDEAMPSFKSLRSILQEGEKIPWNLRSLPVLRRFVEKCTEWVDEASLYIGRKQQNRRKTDTRRAGSWNQKDGKDKENRDVSNIHRLLEEAEMIGFDCPEIGQLRERMDAIKAFQDNAKLTLKRTSASHGNVDELEDLLEEGKGFCVDMPEVDQLTHVVDQIRWNDRCRTYRNTLMTARDVEDLIQDGNRLQIAPYNDNMRFFKEQLEHGKSWDRKAQEVMRQDQIHYPQLEALSTQAATHLLPVSQNVLAEVESYLKKQREAQDQIQDLTDRSHNPDLSKRPKYAEVIELIKKLEVLGAKPSGASDLEKEQRRHEDWMRKGKKLFGKSNAPLHILKTHLEHVYDKNLDCFDIESDKPRVPGEPASRDPSPQPKTNKNNQSNTWLEKHDEVFCICRRSEAGLMIECELCHEWYHAKCLKVARGKVKEEDKYTCPICDYRVRIPRDAARPKLEDLIQWYEEIPSLPFQPEEEQVLGKIIKHANQFRQHVQAFCNPIMSTPSEAETQRFYLRKIEGAEILLAKETNFFRQELHKWHQVAPEPPPILEESKSTRKPRPTKLQRMLNEYGVDEPEQLPESLQAKAQSLKRKSELAAAAAAASTSSVSISGPSNGYHPPRSSRSSFSHAQGRSDGDSVVGSIVSRGIFIDGSLHGSQIFGSDNGSLEEKILRGELNDLDLNTEEGKNQAREILSRNDMSKRKLDEILGGRNIWDDKAVLNDGPGNSAEDENNGEVDKMFMDLTNTNEEEEDDKKTQIEKDNGSDVRMKD